MPKFKVVKAIAVEAKGKDGEPVIKHYMPGAEVELTEAQAKQLDGRVEAPPAAKVPEPKGESKAQA